MLHDGESIVEENPKVGRITQEEKNEGVYKEQDKVGKITQLCEQKYTLLFKQLGIKQLERDKVMNGEDCHPKKDATALDKQVGGNHYKQYKIQPYEFFMANQTPHHKAAIIRRILRYDHETGQGLLDLRKIQHEIELIIEIEGWEDTI